MKKDLNKIMRKIDIKDYSLKEIAAYFENFNNSTIFIKTNKRTIHFKIKTSNLPHMLGIHHVLTSKNKNEYIGEKGFIKIKNGIINYGFLKNNYKNLKKFVISWDLLKSRIEYLPMFFNTLEKFKTIKIMDKNKFIRNSKLKGNYALYKIVKDNNKTIYPILTLKKINSNTTVIETFIIEKDISLIGALEIEKIEEIKLLSSNKKYIHN